MSAAAGSISGPLIVGGLMAQSATQGWRRFYVSSYTCQATDHDTNSSSPVAPDRSLGSRRIAHSTWLPTASSPH